MPLFSEMLEIYYNFSTYIFYYYHYIFLANRVTFSPISFVLKYYKDIMN